MVSQHNPNENKAIEYEVSAQIGGQILLDASDTLHGGRPTVQAIQSEAIGHTVSMSPPINVSSYLSSDNIGHDRANRELRSRSQCSTSSINQKRGPVRALVNRIGRGKPSVAILRTIHMWLTPNRSMI